MAQLDDDGWAKRVEGFLGGVEIASGYQELSDAGELQRLWEENNALRRSLGKAEHPLDSQLIRVSPAMAGVAGMALGLERLLCAIYGGEHIRTFSLSEF